MPNWRFLIVRQFGGLNQRRQTCARIKQQVEQHGLSSVLPLVKFELSRQREYYLGVAVDTNASVSAGNAEDVARQVLLDAGVGAAANRQFCPIVDADQVQALLRGTLECESFTIPLVYDLPGEPETPSADQLLAELDFVDPCAPASCAAESEQYARLLNWCSATGSGELIRLRQACQALGIVSEWGGAWSVLRRLVLLGHLEFDGGFSLRWSTVPPTLIVPDEETDYRILTGQRTPGMIELLGHRVEQCPQDGGPARVLVRGAAGELFDEQGRKLQDVGRVSRELSDLLPSAGDWVDLLPTWEERDLMRFHIERYDPMLDEFHQISRIVGQPSPGLYRFTLDQPKTVTLGFFDDHRQRWICGDFYGLRFLARLRSGMCRAVYCADTHQLVIPLADRWPMPYERALVLASGALPERRQRQSEVGILTYQGITLPLVEQMVRLLGLKLEVYRCTT